MRSLLTLIGVGAALIGCGAPAPSSDAPVLNDLPRATTAAPLLSPGKSSVMDRPYLYQVPSKYDKSKPTPLVIMLHGFTASGSTEELYLNFRAVAESKTWLYAYPDGLKDPIGARYWNAQEWCCDFFKSGVDDVAYIGAVMDDMASKFNVDPKRIYVTGHSNGGFMSHKLACALSDRVAGIVSLAGSQQQDPVAHCQPKQPVPVVEVHGDADALITYAGNANFPGARETVSIWAAKNGCGGRLTADGTNLDLDIGLPGAETKIERYTGCPTNGSVELWTIHGAGHVPLFTANFGPAVFNFFAAHSK